jgi:hypothetical protein
VQFWDVAKNKLINSLDINCTVGGCGLGSCHTRSAAFSNFRRTSHGHPTDSTSTRQRRRLGCGSTTAIASSITATMCYTTGSTRRRSCGRWVVHRAHLVVLSSARRFHHGVAFR